MALSPRSDSHWYSTAGLPAYEVPNASKPGEYRPTTLRDARKMNLLPSVTTIQKQVNKEFLNTWRIEQAIIAALANPTPLLNETTDQHIIRIERAANSVVDEAGKRGTLIHEAIEQFINFGSVSEDPVIRPLVEPYYEWHRKNVEAVDYTEKTIIHRRLGYAGRLDSKMQLIGRGRAVVDYKSRKKGADGKFAVYPENGEQLEAYRQADGEENPMADCCVSIIINSSEPDIMIHEWPKDDCERFWQAWQHLVQRWQILNKYVPVL